MEKLSDKQLKVLGKAIGEGVVSEIAYKMQYSGDFYGNVKHMVDVLGKAIGDAVAKKINNG